MADKVRRVAVTRRVSLADIADDWDDCYAVVTLRTYREAAEVADLDYKSMNQIQILDYEIGVVKKHFVSGQVRVLDDDGTVSITDMTVDDIETAPNIADTLFAAINGVTLDPKDTPREASGALELSNDSNTTKIS